MIGESTHKEILKEDYQQYRRTAEKFRDQGQPDKAADYYRKSAEIVEEMADLESSEKLTAKRRTLAENLADAAEKLEGAESVPASAESGGSGELPDDGDGAAVSDGADTATASGSAGEGDSESAATEFLQSPPDMDFDDVGGMSELKQDLLDKVVDPLERPDLYDTYDLSVVNGVLLYGPPGTGKTHITQALAGKLGYNFIEVTPSDVTSSLVGEAADNVATLFETALENQPCLIFIDEIDAVAGQRSGGAQKTQSERQMVNQLLQELSAVQGEDVVVVAATNVLDAVDDAIKRSGRFDERIEVPPPDEQARTAILRVHLRNRPVLTEEIDWDYVAAETDGYAASDMELIATNAARQALQETRERDEIQRIEQSHIEAAIAETESSLTGWQQS
jgi:transitional endoplasmic reticulum ATPase